MTAAEQLSALLLLAAQKHALKKAVFSKPEAGAAPKSVVTLRQIGERELLQIEQFLADNKAIHKNLELEEATEELIRLTEAYGQVNLLCSAGDCELRRSKNREKATLIGGDKLEKKLRANEAAALRPQGNNREKNRILTGEESFLRALDVSDKNGRIHDKKQAKFRQINRFLELIRDCLPALPAEGALRICDLCCGKSYLSFAAYHYFANVLGREVRMTGVGLKPDVVEHCNRAAAELGFHGLEFLCGDVSAYDAGEHVHLVISLHACDVATDLVLERATCWGAEVILSTPCCHHELNHNIRCDQLSFITDHSMLRQKLCDAATDALRLCYLEAMGYETAALELIDPEETPKNVMLRGLKRPSFRADSPAAQLAKARYLQARSYLTGGLSDVQAVLFPPEGRQE